MPQSNLQRYSAFWEIVTFHAEKLTNVVTLIVKKQRVTEGERHPLWERVLKVDPHGTTRPVRILRYSAIASKGVGDYYVVQRPTPPNDD